MNPLLQVSNAAFPEVEFRAPSVLARDQRMLEFRQLYPLPQREDQQRAFTRDVYLFFPNSFGITPETWGNHVFYRNSRVYSRLHAPTLSLVHLQNIHHPLNPIGLLRQRLPLFLQEHSISGSSLTALAQMAGAELTDAIIQESQVLHKKLKQLTPAQPREQYAALLQRCANFCDNALGALQVLRQTARFAQVYRSVAHPDLLPSLSFAQEYGCAVLDERLSELALEVEQQPVLRDGSGGYLRIRLIFARALEELNTWRREQGFALPHNRDAEYYSYRIHLLKKEVQRSLYIHMHSSKRDPFYANSAAMVAAGLAATWATLAQVPLLTRRWTSTEGIMLFAAAVGAYILKDRIKDLVRQHLTRRWLPWDKHFFMDNGVLEEAGLGAFRGRVRERMQWRDGDHIPASIKQLRRAERTVHGASIELEGVIHYHRRLDLSAEGEQPLPQGYGVQEIHRIALDDIIRRLDEPTDTYFYYDESATAFRQETMPRVYHLNIVHISTDLTSGLQHQHRTRVVLNQKKILRVEQVIQETQQLDPSTLPKD